MYIIFKSAPSEDGTPVLIGAGRTECVDSTVECVLQYAAERKNIHDILRVFSIIVAPRL